MHEDVAAHQNEVSPRASAERCKCSARAFHPRASADQDRWTREGSDSYCRNVRNVIRSRREVKAHLTISGEVEAAMERMMSAPRLSLALMPGTLNAAIYQQL